MKKIKIMLRTFVVGIIAIVMSCSLVGQPVMAVECPPDAINPSASSLADCYVEKPQEDVMTTVARIINVALAVIGLVAAVVIIAGGASFVMSQGDPAKVAKAKNTILYGVVGLVIALLAFAIVNFILVNIFK